MPKQGKSLFTTWELSDEDEIQGSILSDLNIMVLQNMIATFAESKLAIKYNPMEPLIYAQEEAEITGQIGILQHLLVINENARERMRAINETKAEEKAADSLPENDVPGFIAPASSSN